MHDIIDEVCQIIRFDPSTAHYCLSERFRWNQGSLIEDYFAKEPLWAYELEPTLRPDAAVVKEPWSPDWVDPVYWESSDREDETTVLSCGHRFLNRCLGVYLKSRVTDPRFRPRDLLKTPCPSCSPEKCKALIPDAVWQQHAAKEIEDARMRRFVENHPKFSSCPDCQQMFHLRGDSGRERMVQCCQGSPFCFDCRNTSHTPVPCKIMIAWGETDWDDVSRMWLDMNTKKCPNEECGRNLQKNEGCDHMTCKCGASFCWLCLKQWQGHTQCIVPPPADIRKEKVLMDHFDLNRDNFRVHQDKEKQAKESIDELPQLETRIRDASGEFFAQQAISCLKEAYMEMIRYRCILKCSYAYSFYLIDPSEENRPAALDLFLFHQGSFVDLAVRPSIAFAIYLLNQ